LSGNPVHISDTIANPLAKLVAESWPAFLALLGTRVIDQVRRRAWEMRPFVILVVPVAVWFAVMTVGAYQYGVRYILPAYPLLFVYVAGLVHAPIMRRPRMPLIVLALAFAFAAGSVRAHPHYLPYFNMLAGGPDNGIEWLDDSNVDWGQDLPLLARYLEENGITDAVVAPMTWYDPALYGVQGRVVGPADIIALLTDRSPPAGVYVASAHLLTRARFDPATPVDPLSDLEPVAVLGHSIWVFER
jgi:hypothetical protein